MKGFIIHSTYRIIDNETWLYIFAKLDNGESCLIRNREDPYFFIKESDLKKALKLLTLKHESTKLKNMQEEPVVKIITTKPGDVPSIRKHLIDHDIKCYEADILFTSRKLMDYDLLGSFEIKDEHFKKGNYVNRIYENIQLYPAQWTPTLKTLSFDIETDKKANTLFSIALYWNEGASTKQEAMIVKDKPVKNAKNYDHERKLLVAFKEHIQEIDPDIITGWNLIDFDLKILRNKFKEYNIPFQLGRAEWDCKLHISEEFMRESKAEIPGRQVLDGIHILRTSFVKLDDYKLNTAAKTILGEEKLITTVAKGEEIERRYHEAPEELIDYNIKDAKLVYDILDKGTLALTIHRSLLTGMELNRVSASIASLDSLYLREMRKRGYVAPTLVYAEKENPITGGYVMNSKPGIYDYVIVCDFKSLYPSVMRTFNIDPMSFITAVTEKTKSKYTNKKKYVITPTNAIYKNEQGILPKLLADIWKSRDEMKKKKNKTSIYALKVVMNSFWGALASPRCRFFSMDMANSITKTCQHFIKMTIKHIEEKGYEVIYGDTDSVFVNINVTSVEEANTLGKKIAEEMNNTITKYVKTNYGRESFLELEFEKIYERFLLPTVRGSDIGSKKRYAGLMVIDNLKGRKMDFTGLEFVRRDWTELSKKFQLELLDLIFHRKEIADYVKQFIENLKKGKYDNLLIYRKALRKSPDAYTKTTPPHVKAARKLKKITSNIIEYVITTDGPEPTEALHSQIDYDHYIEKQIKPIADSVLSFYNKTFEEVLEGNTQKGLLDY